MVYNIKGEEYIYQSDYPVPLEQVKIIRNETEYKINISNDE
jgi:hypothetical protein